MKGRSKAQVASERSETGMEKFTVPSPEEWDEFVLSRDGHLLQSWGWGELKTRFGWEATRLAVWDEAGRQPRGVAQVLVRRLPLGSLAYVPKGPVADVKDTDTWRELLGTLRDFGRELGVTFLKIEPDGEAEHPLRQLFEEEGYTVSARGIQPGKGQLIVAFQECLFNSIQI